MIAVQREGRIGQAVSERVARMFVKCIKIPVADIDAFRIGSLNRVL